MRTILSCTFAFGSVAPVFEICISVAHYNWKHSRKTVFVVQVLNTNIVQYTLFMQTIDLLHSSTVRSRVISKFYCRLPVCQTNLQELSFIICRCLIIFLHYQMDHNQVWYANLCWCQSKIGFNHHFQLPPPLTFS